MRDRGLKNDANPDATADANPPWRQASAVRGGISGCRGRRVSRLKSASIQSKMDRNVTDRDKIDSFLIEFRPVLARSLTDWPAQREWRVAAAPLEEAPVPFNSIFKERSMPRGVHRRHN
jgi:hypothetical protein